MSAAVALGCAPALRAARLASRSVERSGASLRVAPRRNARFAARTTVNLAKSTVVNTGHVATGVIAAAAAVALLVDPAATCEC
jgi:hypothetical protein